MIDLFEGYGYVWDCVTVG